MPAAPSRDRSIIRRRVVLLLLTIGIASAAVIAVLLHHLYGGAMVAGEKLVTAFAQITDEQSTRTVQNIEQTLEIAEARLQMKASSRPGELHSLDTEISELLKGRPFLRALWVLDEKGRTIFASDGTAVGVDRSDRPYFLYHRDDHADSFHLDRPYKDSASGEWYIPATRSWRKSDGRFGGVVVAAVDPRHFDRAWTLDDDYPGYVIGVLRTDGWMLRRSPFQEKAFGAPLSGSPALDGLGKGNNTGTYEVRSTIDGEHRLLAYRRLAAYPTLFVLVGVSVDRVLADWWVIAAIVAVGWVVSMMLISAFGIWLGREWTARLASEKLYRMLFDANPYPMVVADRGTFRYWAVNNAAVRQYGWSREEFLRMTSLDIRAPGDEPMLREAVAAGELDSDIVFHGHKHRRKDGSMIDVELAFRPIEFNGKPAVLSIANDVTGRLQTERARQTAEEQLRQAQKMETVGQLTGGIAHDFNNILTVILANADSLQEEESLDPTIAGRLDEIACAVQRAADLTRQLLAFSRKQPLKPQPTDINQLVTGTGRLLRRTLGEHVEIESLLAGGICVVNVDRAQLETALVNLCINARDAMPAGGKLMIETRNVTLDEQYVARHPDLMAGDYAMLAVTDTGTGMAPDVMDKVFEPFFTTKEVGKGTGLGLSMVYGFIKQSRGHVSVYSELGHGTTFKVYLPCGAEAEPEVDRRQPEAVVGGNERILVVEDDAKVRAGVVANLRGLGYTVEEAADGSQGLAVLESAAEPFDLVLTDVVMPGPMNGKSLADAVTRRSPATRVVFMSGYPEDAIVHHGQLDKGVLLLSKPFRNVELARILREALGRRPTA